MATFLLWNVDGEPSLDGLVQSLTAELHIDIVLLVEYASKESQLPERLLKDEFLKVKSPEGFGIFTRVDQTLERLPYRLGKRAGLWRWTPPSGQEGLLVLLHGFDRIHNDDSTRRVFFRHIAEAVKRRERAQGHRRTIIAGDFNAHPFESAITDSDGLHAIGVHAISSKSDRWVVGARARKDFFYNPMWRMYGHQQHPEAAAATHYWRKSGARELVWHMLDQVVLRPEESARFPEDQLRIVTHVGGISLLDEYGHPDRKTASDHLPLVFHWNL